MKLPTTREVDNSHEAGVDPSHLQHLTWKKSKAATYSGFSVALTAKGIEIFVTAQSKDEIAATWKVLAAGGIVVGELDGENVLPSSVTVRKG